MPELPEVQTIVNELSGSIIGRSIQSCEVLRGSVINGDSCRFTQNIVGRNINSVSRKGKYILFSLSGDCWLVIHLRMTGKLILKEIPLEPNSHNRVIFYLDKKEALVFNDIRCFGRLEFEKNIKNHKGIKKLGWDPWNKNLTAKRFSQKVGNRQTSIKSILLDQRIISGLGNIYVAEILFDAEVNPLVAANSLSESQISKLLKSTRKILTLALKHNGTSISDFRRIDDKQGDFQNFLKVYGKEGHLCIKCNSKIKKITQNQRSTYYCPWCQR